jgi:hypothetical protein
LRRGLATARAALAIALVTTGFEALPAEAIGAPGQCTLYDYSDPADDSVEGAYCLHKQRWAWDRMPLGFRINEAGAPIAGAAAEIRAAFAAWEALIGSAVDFVDLGTTTATTSCDDRTITVHWSSTAGARAQTFPCAVTNADGSQTRVDADIAVNPAHPWETQLDLSTPAQDLRWAVMHEIGHVIGLEHIVGCDWIMGVKKVTSAGGQYTYDACGETRTITPDDAAGATKLWPQGWLAAKSLGRPSNVYLQDDPDIASWGEGRLDIVARGDDGDVWVKSHRVNQTWGTWGSIGAPSWRTDAGVYLTYAKYGPTAVSWGPNRIDVFVVGPDDGLWHRYYTTSWSASWTPLGGQFLSSPDAASWGSGRIDVVGRGGDDAIWHRWYDTSGGGWNSGWVKRDGTTYDEPGVVSWGPQRLDIFVRGTDNGIWHRAYNAGGWSAWTPRGGQVTDGVDVASWGTNRLDVFTRCNGSAWDLCQLWYDGSWNPMANFSGDLAASPGAVSWQGSVARLDVVYRTGSEIHLRSYSR